MEPPRFAEALLPLIDENPQNASALAMQVIEAFPSRFELAIETGWCHKIGLPEATPEDVALALELLKIMTEQRADFTLTFRALGDELIGGVGAEAGTAAEARADVEAGATLRRARDLFDDPTAFDAWAARWRARLAALGADLEERRKAMQAVNPRYIPRNHRVEQAIRAAEDEDDLGPFERLLEVLEKPYEEQPGREEYSLPPKPEERVTRTFCGT